MTTQEMDPAKPGEAGPPEMAEAQAPGAPEPELDATAPEGVGEDDGFAMSEADAKLAEANGRYVRLAADFENFRKRTQKEKMELAAAVQEDLIREVLPVVDNLERALAAGAETQTAAGAADAVVRGVELTLRLFQTVLGRVGVEKFEAKGQPFDPHRHEALSQEEHDGLTEDTVLEVHEPGYVMNGRVVRPAKVKVGRPKSS